MELGGDCNGDDERRGDDDVGSPTTASTTVKVKVTASCLLSSPIPRRTAMKKRKLPLGMKKRKKKKVGEEKERSKLDEGEVEDGGDHHRGSAVDASSSPTPMGEGITVPAAGRGDDEESAKDEMRLRADVDMARTDDSTGAAAAARETNADGGDGQGCDSLTRRVIDESKKRGATAATAKKKKKAAVKKDGSTTKGTAPAGGKKTKSTRKKAAVTSRKAAVTGRKKGGGGANTRKTRKRKKVTEDDADDSSVATSSVAAGSVAGDAVDDGEEDDDEMYKRHVREFERIVDRLERVDPFAFFLGEVPPSLDDSESDGEGKEGDASNAENDVKGGEIGEKMKGEAASPLHAEATDTDVSKLPVLPSLGTMANDDNRGPAVDRRPELPRRRKRDRAGKPEKPPFNFVVLRRRMAKGRYVLDRVKVERERRKRLRPPEAKAADGEEEESPQIKLAHPRGVNWPLFRSDVVAMTDAAISRDPRGTRGKSGTLGHASLKIQRAALTACDRTGSRHSDEMDVDDVRMRFRHLTAGNDGGAVQTEWRRKPFPERVYERLDGGNVPCSGLSEFDGIDAEYELRTSLPDGFVGMPYNYDEAEGHSEEWMKSLGEAAVAAAAAGKNGGKTASRGQDAKARRAAAALAADDGVVRAQVSNTVQALLMRVQERCMTEMGILEENELRSVNGEDFASTSTSTSTSTSNSLISAGAKKSGESDSADPGSSSSHTASGADGAAGASADVVANAVDASDSRAVAAAVKQGRRPHAAPPPAAEVAEHAVWGIDCYTRRNVVRCLLEDIGPKRTEEFIERWLLPSINACPTRLAHDIAYASRILEGEAPEDFIDGDGGGGGRSTSTNTNASPCPSQASAAAERHHQTVLGRAIVDKVRSSGPPWIAEAARRLRLVASAYPDAFRIHPKGHGAVCVKPGGLPAHSLVTHYRGEIYPSWRWGEKMDAIEETQRRLDLRPALADFYNMTLERPRNDPRGYGLLFVDASRRAGFGSSFSHSCSPTCEVRVVAVGGRLSLAITTAKDVELGEELTFDYNAVTESVDEYMAAICLCGHTRCRGSFLHYATADCYQQVLERNSPVAVRLAGLIRSSTKRVLSNEDAAVLARHGFGTAAFGAVSFRHDDGGDDTSSSSPGRHRPTVRDSMDNVPVWLRTFVADTLRYIEYERRALPVALLCDHFDGKGDGDKPSRQQPKASSPRPESKVGGEGTSAVTSVPRQVTKKTTKKKKKRMDRSVCTDDDVDSSVPRTTTIPPQREDRSVPVSTREDLRGCDGGDDSSLASSPSASKGEAGATGDCMIRTAAEEGLEEDERETNSAEACTISNGKSPSKPSVARKDHHPSNTSVCAPSSPRPNHPVSTNGPVSPFILYSQRKQDDFLQILTEKEGGNMSDLSALQQMQAVQKIAGDEWRRLSAEERQRWKKLSVADFEMCKKESVSASSDATVAGTDLKSRKGTSRKEPRHKLKAKKKTKKGGPSKKVAGTVVTKLRKVKDDGHMEEADTLSKSVRGSKALSSFLYFSRQKRDEFISVLEKNGEAGNLKGIGLVRATQKIAGEEWGKLAPAEKQAWKEASIRDWEASGGHKKAKMEQNRRRKLIQVERKQAALKVKNEAEESRVKQMEDDAKREAEKESRERQEEEDARAFWERVESETGRDSKTDVSSSGDASQPISFVAADAEGRSSMEQRIQALTQTLSRVGRALSRHRDAAAPKKEPNSSGGYDDVHAPLRLLTNEEVVYHLWNREDGVVRSLVDCAESEPCCSSSLKDGLAAITAKYSHLDAFDGRTSSKVEPSPVSSFDARRSLNNALLEFRRCILTALKIAEDDERDTRTTRKDPAGQSAQIVGAEATTTTPPEADFVREENGGNPVRNSPEAETSFVEEKPAEKDRTCPKCFDLLPCECIVSSTGILEEDAPTVVSRDAEAVMMENRLCSAGKFLIVRSGGIDDEPEHRESTESARKGKTVSCSSYESSSLENSHHQNTRYDDEVFRESTGADSVEILQEGVTDLDARAGMIHNDETRATPSSHLKEGRGVEISLSMPSFSFDFSPSSSNNLSWQEFRSRKYRLEAAADVLLMYAHTSTFLVMEPYTSFESTPINVYARELGNKVPRSLIEDANEYGASNVNTTAKCESLEFHRSSPLRADSPTEYAIDDEDASKSLNDDGSIHTQSTVRSGDGVLNDEYETDSVSSQRRARKRKKTEKKTRKAPEEYCKPEEAVTSVSRRYSGEYVLSQLLQWFNGGIGTKPGLPDILGCAMLPSMRSCWGTKEDVLVEKREGDNQKSVSPESYVAGIQPRLVEWLENRVSRGSCWPSLLQSFFCETIDDAKENFPGDILLGSPVLDLLVTGDDSNISMVLHGLKHRTSNCGNRNPEKAASTIERKSRKERLQSKMDEGMPPQAVSNWVQCENPHCLKWRKLPFHVDVDLLPETFFCKDNVWNPLSSSCDAPPDPWDEHQETTASCKLGNIGESDLVLKARFDVFRKKSRKYLVAQVVETDFVSDVKKVKFHFQRLKKEHDEWIEVGSTRIAPLHSFTAKKKKKGKDMISGGDIECETDLFSNESNEAEGILTLEHGRTNTEHTIT